MLMRVYDDDAPMRHKKKSQKKRPPKTDHQHFFESCVLQYQHRLFDGRYATAYETGSYCPVCGKLWVATNGRFGRISVIDERVVGKSGTETGISECLPGSRTTPLFHLDGAPFLEIKYVNLEEK